MTMPVYSWPLQNWNFEETTTYTRLFLIENRKDNIVKNFIVDADTLRDAYWSVSTKVSSGDRIITRLISKEAKKITSNTQRWPTELKSFS